MVFLRKEPCMRAHVLTIVSCPPDVVHDTQKYPLCYDLLYYPQCHSAVFANACSFSLWLQSLLEDHGWRCPQCSRTFHCISVAFDSTETIVELDDRVVALSWAYFEVASYSHCSVFQCFTSKARNPTLDMTSSLVAALDADRAWLTNPSASYVANLDLLPAPVLHAAAQRIGCKRSDARLKSLSIKALVSHFEIRWTELSYQSIDMLSRCLTIPLPSVCLQTRVILITAVVEDTYGIDVAAALHPPLFFWLLQMLLVQCHLRLQSIPPSGLVFRLMSSLAVLSNYHDLISTRVYSGCPTSTIHFTPLIHIGNPVMLWQIPSGFVCSICMTAVSITWSNCIWRVVLFLHPVLSRILLHWMIYSNRNSDLPLLND